MDEIIVTKFYEWLILNDIKPTPDNTKADVLKFLQMLAEHRHKVAINSTEANPFPDDSHSDMNLGIEAFRSYLTQSMEQWGAKYELQYSDYSENQWTAPVSLTDERIERIVTDFSIKNVRLSFTV
jgi:hypothetical protein